MADEPRPAHAEGMADRDRAAIDVDLLGIDAERVAAIERLRGEGLVQLPEVDVGDLQAVALQQARHGEDRADAHLVGLAAGRGEAAEDAERRQAAPRRLLRRHHHAGRGAVRELAGIAGRDELVLAAHRLELEQAFQRGVGPVALVLAQRHRLLAGLAGRLVGDRAWSRSSARSRRRRAGAAGPPPCGAGSPARTRPAPRARCRSARATMSAVSIIEV